jgi:fatty acid desaturase
MRRLSALLALLAFLAPVATAAAGAGPAAASSPEILAFRGFHLGGGSFGRSRSFGGYGYRRRGFGLFGRRRHGFLRTVARYLAFAYLAHLFFSHGGVSILLWLLIIGLVVHLLRRRRRRATYA